MSFFQEYSLLFAVAIPVAAIVAINAALWISGERDNLLLPGVMSFPRVAMDEAVPMPVDVAPAAQAPVSTEAANDDDRIAA